MNERPFVSILIPIRNEAGFIARSLGAVLAQDYPHDRMEVLVADGMSTDGTRQKIAEVAQRYPHIPVTILDNPGKFVPTGLNLAVQRAQGAVIVRVDGHTIIEPTYVSECVAALERSGADNVGGRMAASGTTPFGEAVALATSSPFGVGGARFHYSDKEEWVDTVYMGAWPRATFERIGKFDKELVRNQDDEFNYRLLSQGGKILLSNRIRSEYFNRGSLRTLARQYFEYGYWKVRVMQKHPNQIRPRQLVPVVLVVAIIGGMALTPVNRLIRYLWLLTVIVYSVGNVAASCSLAARHGWRHLRWLPLAFGTLHFSYGTGFLIGLIKFARRWSERS
ncbi:MAG: glycosyltransferase family 2 protein [Aggregatilineales bacterium]